MEWLDRLMSSLDEYFSRNDLAIIKGLNADVKQLRIENKILDGLVDVGAEKVVALEDELKKYLPDPLEDELNNKIDKIQRSYVRQETDGQYNIDVRNYWNINDELIPTVRGANYDEKALNALKKVRSMVQYTSDKLEYGFDEYWAYAYQTIKRQKGDCEDGAILLANIMLRSGIPYYRIRINAGSVNGGGHAYVTYCRETDNQFVVLDWCYWPKTTPIKDRPTHKEERNYMNKEKNFYVWFSWNTKYIFGKEKSTEGFSNGE